MKNSLHETYDSLLNYKIKTSSEFCQFTGLCAMVKQAHTSPNIRIYMTATFRESGRSLTLEYVGNRFIQITNHYAFRKPYSTAGRLSNLIRLTGQAEN